MKKANDYFGNSTGSENFYQSKLSPIIYTDGVKDLADTCSAYWLIDLIISHQSNKLVRNESFQVWRLEHICGKHFTVKASDGNEKEIARQEIPFSDFTYDLAILWLVNGCLMLPNEY